ncbi:MAG: NADH-quinone oxidoreductase subunit H [Planctomycetes bacterium]|nr:NADH-quinone oxidoreductase subunit H [Planctomycetota bacterium]
MSLVGTLLALLLLPFLLIGIVQRTRSWWAGRRGPGLWQSAFDVQRLLRKQSVYSTTTTPLFRIAPWVFLASAVGSALLTPVLGLPPVLSFPFDFVWFLYAFGLGRVAIMLAALDTGSSFEGMGAAREGLFASLLEPVWFAAFGALFCLTDATSLAELLPAPITGLPAATVVAAVALALLVAVQVESARVPVDDPATHLELTMIHEVQVLDHSGPDLAAIQIGSALKLFIGASLLVALLHPCPAAPAPWPQLVAAGMLIGVAVLIGTIESLVARLQLRMVPWYIGAALLLGTVGLLATAWRGEGGR